MEFIRQFLRTLLPQKFYSTLSELTDSIFVILTEGIKTLNILNSRSQVLKK